MKKNEDENSKYIKETLAKSKTLTKSANLFLQQNNLTNNNNPNQNPKFPQDTEEPKKKKYISSKEEREAIKEDLNEEDEKDDQNTDDEENNGIFTMEYITKNIERYQKQVSKFDELVRKNLLLSKKHPEKKDEYKTEAIRALKKKKFYSKCLERYEDKKCKLEIKNLDKEYKMQKKELRKLTKKLKKRVRMVTMGEEYDDEGEDSENSDEDNDIVFSQIDLDDKALEEQYEQIINQPEIKNANENLNLFKFIFQEE
jgi:hypothetical protein